MAETTTDQKPPRAALVEKENTALHQTHSDWLYEQTGVRVDPTHIRLVTALRVEFRKSDVYKDYKETREEEAEKARQEKARQKAEEKKRAAAEKEKEKEKAKAAASDDEDDEDEDDEEVDSAEAEAEDEVEGGADEDDDEESEGEGESAAAEVPSETPKSAKPRGRRGAAGKATDSPY